MATLDDFKNQVSKTADFAKEKTAEFTEAANEWADKSRPGMDSALESAGNVAQGAIDKASQGLDAVYEVIKNKAEEATGRDVDGDGQVGNTGAAEGEVKAGIDVADTDVTLERFEVGAAATIAKDAISRLVSKNDGGSSEEVEGEIIAEETVEAAEAAAADEATAEGEAASTDEEAVQAE